MVQAAPPQLPVPNSTVAALGEEQLIHQPVPVQIGARQARGFQGEDRSDFLQRDFCHQALEIRSVGGLGARDPQVVIQGEYPLRWPAQLQGLVPERVWALGAFLVLAHLFEGGLAQVNAGQLLAMSFLDRLGVRTRRSPAQEAEVNVGQPNGRPGAWWRGLAPPVADRSARPPTASLRLSPGGVRVRD